MPGWIRLAAVGAIVMLGLAACDSDDGGGDLAAYCELSAELDDTEGFPSDEQLEDLRDAAPDEISDEVGFVVDRVTEADDPREAFEDDEVNSRIETLEEFEAENCDRPDPDDADEGEGGGEGDEGDEDGEAADIDPEFASYCAAVTEIDEGEDVPTVAQVEALNDIAPEEIADEVASAVDAFAAAEGNIGAFLADPDAQAALVVLEPWEADNCGPAQAEPDLIEPEGDEDPAEGAEVVDVTAVEYAFDGVPEELAAGPVAFSVTNGGAEGHEMSMARLADGTTMDEVLAFEGDPFGEGLLTEETGQVFIPTPGDTRVINAELEAGTYGFVCFIPGPDGAPHAMLGMAGSVTVT